MSKKLYHLQSHLCLTISDSKSSICKLGLTDYAIKYFLRFNKVDYSNYPKTKYGITNATLIKLFIEQTFQKYQNDLLRKEQTKGAEPFTNNKPASQLSYSQKVEYDRFLIKKGEPFSLVKTYEYDIELIAPVDMRVIDLNHDIYYWDKFLTVPYFFQVECLNLPQLNKLITEEQYVKSPKFFQFC